MKILILGGTQFLGRHIVDSLLKNKAEITLFNRGQTNPSLYPKIEHIKGDRKTEFQLLKNRAWDVVIDTSGYEPNNLREIATILKDNIKHYVFISSCSVYDHNPGCSLDPKNPSYVNLELKDYGAKKLLSERALDAILGDIVTHIRPGLIVGPFDTTFRFAYWIDRLIRDGPILAPGYPDSPLQFIDARDIADWIIEVIHQKYYGVFNLMGPRDQTLTLQKFLDIAQKTLNNTSSLTWVSEDFLKEKEVGCWVELPLWVYKEIEVFLQRDSSKVRDLGIKYRPIEQSIKDTRDWLISKVDIIQEMRRETLDPLKEAELLKEWNSL